MISTPPRPPESRPSKTRIPVIRWVRLNLFGTPFNAVLTLVAAGIITGLVLGLGRWAITEARWDVIPANLKTLLVGTYPVDQLWRLWTIVVLLAWLAGFNGGRQSGTPRHLAFSMCAFVLLLSILPFTRETRVWSLGSALAGIAGLAVGFIIRNIHSAWIRQGEILAWLASLPISLILLHGVGGALPIIEVRTHWGFLLNLLGAIIGIALSLPIGVLLALGRRSKLPAIRWVCTAYIEIIRGVPLISLLFMASIMLQLLLPDHIRPDLFVRAMVTITAFSAAYMAENVRGGLQAIPEGQTEAAYALGLGRILTLVLVILPQALRAVIPAIIGQFIALFKDTTLFGFIAILEVLSLSRSIVGNLEWRGRIFELYVFIGVLFWGFCYSISTAGKRIERSLSVSDR